LPFCRTNNAIEVFRHALALDERRVKFIPSFYQSGKSKHDHTDSEHQQVNSIDQKTNGTIQRTNSNSNREFECRRNAMLGKETDVQEVFFAGAHCGTI
jgi:adenylate cyclase